MKEYISPQVEVLRIETKASVIATSTETLYYKNGSNWMFGDQEEAW